MGPKGKAIKEPIIAISMIPIIANKKRVLVSFILDSNIWNKLALPETPKEGEKQFQLWLVIHT